MRSRGSSPRSSASSTQFLPREDQLPPRQRARQRLAVDATEHHVTAAAFGARMADAAGQRRALAEFGGELGFEAGTAVAEQTIVRPGGNEGSFARCERASDIAAHHGWLKTVVGDVRPARVSGAARRPRVAQGDDAVEHRLPRRRWSWRSATK